MSSKKINKPTCLDLFCGAGGLSCGFESAGYDVLAGIDFWKDALVTYSANHRHSQAIQADMKTLDPEDIMAKIGCRTVDVICGGPPCQGFSIAGKRIVDDERNTLYKSFVRFVAAFSPKAFVMENVPNILSIGAGVVREAILSDFKKLGYTVSYQILNAADYGVPQARRRAFFVGLKNTEFKFPSKRADTPISIKDAISDLPEEALEEGAPYPTPPKTA